MPVYGLRVAHVGCSASYGDGDWRTGILRLQELVERHAARGTCEDMRRRVQRHLADIACNSIYGNGDGHLGILLPQTCKGDVAGKVQRPHGAC